MLDRESIFADPEIIKALQTQFIPVAIDQAYQRRQKDTEGDFYRKIAKDGPRNDFQSGTTQGLYVADPTGKFLGYTNHRSPERTKKLIAAALKQYQPDTTKVIQRKKVDKRYSPKLEEGGLVVRVQAKILGGYEPTDDKWLQIFQSALSRDNLWISASEANQIAKGSIPKSVQNRIAKFHLVDNTRGEPPMWRDEEIKSAKMEILKNVKNETLNVRGAFQLETSNGKRGYHCDVAGKIKTKDGKVTQFDLVAKGDFWGEGRYTKRAPKGKFPLAISFRLADGSDVADPIPPQGSRGWIQGYLR